MAYQNIGTPRFYVNTLEWLAETKAITLPSIAWRTLPVAPNNGWGWNQGAVPTITSNIIRDMPAVNYNFLMMLGHNYGSGSAADQEITSTQDDPVTPNDVHLQLNDSSWSMVNLISIANGGYKATNGWHPIYNGFSIWEFTKEQATDLVVYINFNHASDTDIQFGKVGSVIVGSYYDMENAPNLSLTMSREYGSTKEFTTYNGSTISNTMWTKPPMWGDLGAWELSDGTSSSQVLSRSGRRTWDLEFSYMDDGDLWGPNQSLSTYLEGGVTTGLDPEDIGPSYVPIPDNLGIDGTFASAYNQGWDPFSSYGGTTGTVDIVDSTLRHTQGSGISSGMQLPYNPPPEGISNPTIGEQYQISFNLWQGTSTSSAWQIVFAGGYMAFEIDDNPNKVHTMAMEAGTQLLPVIFTADDIEGNIGNTVFLDNVVISQPSDSAYQNNLLTDQNFFSQVWHKTLGGTLPFIFQPDGGANGNFNPDQFAICRFKSNSLKATQTAFHVYDISLQIEEAW